MHTYIRTTPFRNDPEKAAVLRNICESYGVRVYNLNAQNYERFRFTFGRGMGWDRIWEIIKEKQSVSEMLFLKSGICGEDYRNN